MSDAFADLWSTTNPAKPKAPLLSSSTSSSAQSQSRPGSSKPDVFSLLAGAGSGASTPRYGSGYAASASATSSRPITPSLSSNLSQRSTPQPQLQAQPQKLGSDAFGDLFSTSSSSGANGTGNMTLAAKLAMQSTGGGVGQRGQAASATSAAVMSPSASAWAGLDALAGGLTATPAPTTSGGGGGKNIVVDDVDDWGLGDFGSAPTTTTTTKTVPTNGSNTATVRRKPKIGTSLWDLEEFASGSTPAPVSHQPHHGHATAHKANAKLASPDEDFDFGGREDRVDEERWEHRAHRGAGHKHGHGHGRGQDKLLDFFDDDTVDGPASAQGLLGSNPHGHEHRHDEDDVLGLLSKPVEVVKAHHTPSPEPARQRPPPPTSSNTTTRGPNPPSPPPHILGQIVEMGFSVQQARVALAQTSTGMDVQTAIENLLGGSGGRSTPSNAIPQTRERQVPQAEEPPQRTRGAPKGQKERERERLERQRLAASSFHPGGDGGSTTPSVADIQEQADKLLAQASEIGLSVFSKASAMWGKGKEKVVKAYEERASATASVSTPGASVRGAGRGDGRPKWMQDQEHEHDVAGEEVERHGHAHRSGFRDDEDDHGHRDVVFEAPEEDDTRVPKPETSAVQPHHEEEIDLFSDAPVAPRTQAQPPAAAPPPSRTAPLRRPQAPTRQSSTASSIRSTPVQPPAPIPERALPTASPSALSTALAHKNTGTEAFKLGQYAGAVEAYSKALAALPRGHLLRVPLLTNRALARIRCGEYKGAEDDCKEAVGVVMDDESGSGSVEDEFGGIGSSSTAKAGKTLIWSPSRLPASLLPTSMQTPQSAWTNAQGRGVDLADGYVKALRRRAEALEGREKWELAAADWEILAGCAWAAESVRRDAVRGRGRCKGMEGGAAAASTTSLASTSTSTKPVAAKPKPKPKPIPTSTAPSTALRALQSQNAQAEADDALKFSLKDSVDARLAAWRQGREGNIRALLVGLDGVLWDGALEGVRVKGLHELVSGAQVKKGYVRVIGRVHPDKLNSSNSTIEQRMLANGVFGTLNEAWIAFQATQK
ncbi:hypothetical protein BDN70DRAFT_839700 [Pholiota conissans]|uniref:UBA domain-containing protein n=1 Tax=Pholiota conissans TaxID=109636 RepID=A0A9P5YY76_9AGAR|nr:hypothetical protein BDN70DRAFT_839700 [Pholiota conissans]